MNDRILKHRAIEHPDDLVPGKPYYFKISGLLFCAEFKEMLTNCGFTGSIRFR